jgi:hypothetical protein
MVKLINKVVKFFDILEDKVRHYLSHWPIIYALIGILGLSLTWRGVWYLADQYNLAPWLSAIIGILILLSTGLLVAVAIGDEVIISAFRGRRKVTEIKMEDALTLAEKVEEIKDLLEKIEKKLEAVKTEEKKIEKEIETRI